jgi:hypothetical protein
MRLLATMATVSLIALAGCGGDDKDSDSGSDRGYDPAGEVRSVLNDYFAALADGDGEKACGFLSEDGRKKIEDAGQGECAALVETGVEQTGKDPYKDVKLSSIEVTDDTATTHYSIEVEGQTVEADQSLVKEDGEWKLEAADTAGG